MLELYERFTNDRTAVPSANIVRSFKNEGTYFFACESESTERNIHFARVLQYMHMLVATYLFKK